MADIVLPVPGENPNWATTLNTAILRINQELEALGVRVSRIDSDLSSVTLRVTNLEGRVTQLEDNLEAEVRRIAADVIASDPTIIEAAENAVDDAVADLDLIQAYPATPPVRTSLRYIPVHWDAKLLNDPYTDAYDDTYFSEWNNVGPRSGSLPVLDWENRIFAEQIPAGFARTSYVDSQIAEVVAQIPETFQTERHINSRLPIFAAHLAAARQAGEPCAGVIAGSSTSAQWPGYLQGLAPIIQSAYPVANPSAVQRSASADFTRLTNPGFHLYSAAQGGTRSDTYLTDEEAQKIAALDPAFIMHMVVNDYSDQTDPAVYGANVLDRIEYLDTLLTKPTQHILAFPYARMAFNAHTYHWDEYGAALEQVASTRLDTVFVNLNDAYVAVGVTSTGSDPLDLISDNLHQTSAGYRFMVGLFADVFTS